MKSIFKDTTDGKQWPTMQNISEFYPSSILYQAILFQQNF